MEQRFVEELADGRTLKGEALAHLGREPFAVDVLGLTLDAVSLRRVEAHVDTDERHHQPYGIVHGGVWCAVVETLASLGAAVNAMVGDQIVVGVSNATDFLRAHRGGRVDAVGAPIHIGRTQQLWQVVLTRSEDGKAVARGQVRLQNLAPDRDLAGRAASTGGQ